MNPVFTISNDNGLIGYWYDEFVNQFDQICLKHLEEKRAKRFAFIIFDFHSETHSTLQNQGVFTELDRLSAKDITIFYLDGQLRKQRITQKRLFQNLNSVVTELASLSIDSIPFILFFDFNEGEIENFKYYPIRDSKKFILNDLTKAVLEELPRENKKKQGSIDFIKETPKIIYTEFIKLILKDIFELDM